MIRYADDNLQADCLLHLIYEETVVRDTHDVATEYFYGLLCVKPAFRFWDALLDGVTRLVRSLQGCADTVRHPRPQATKAGPGDSCDTNVPDLVEHTHTYNYCY